LVDFIACGRIPSAGITGALTKAVISTTLRAAAVEAIIAGRIIFTGNLAAAFTDRQGWITNRIAGTWIANP